MTDEPLLLAYEEFQRLSALARTVRAHFESAGEPLPTPLKAFFGIGHGREPRRQSMTVPPMESPTRPPGAQEDWFWIKTSELSIATLVLAILRAADGPMAPTRIVAEVREHNEKCNAGSVYNVGPRLDGKQINRTEDGWKLIDKDAAPILLDGYAWGPKSVFQKQELAAQRRHVILHLLNTSADGLMAMQLLRQLRQSKLAAGPVNKDLVKADLEVMKTNKIIKRMSNSKKWTLTASRAQ